MSYSLLPCKRGEESKKSVEIDNIITVPQTDKSFSYSYYLYP